MRILDWVAGRLGYVRAPTKPIESEMSTPEFVAADQGSNQSDKFVPTPAYFGLPDSVTFKVVRGDQVSSTPVTFDEVLDFADACGIDLTSDEVTLALIFGGLPFEIDGATMRFIPEHS